MTEFDHYAELPDARGFSERNLKRMAQYTHAYPEIGQVLEPGAIGPQAVAQWATRSPQAACAHLSLELPWGHNILLCCSTELFCMTTLDHSHNVR